MYFLMAGNIKIILTTALYDNKNPVLNTENGLNAICISPANPKEFALSQFFLRNIATEANAAITTALVMEGEPPATNHKNTIGAIRNIFFSASPNIVNFLSNHSKGNTKKAICAPETATR